MITLLLRDNRDFLLSSSSVQSGSQTRRGDLKLGDERGWQEGRKGETISRVSTATSPPPASNGGETGLSHLTISWIRCEHVAPGAVSMWKVFLDSFWLSDPVFSSWTQHEWCLGGCEVYLRSVQLRSCLWCEFDVARNKWGSSVGAGLWRWLSWCYSDGCGVLWDCLSVCGGPFCFALTILLGCVVLILIFHDEWKNSTSYFLLPKRYSFLPRILVWFWWAPCVWSCITPAKQAAPIPDPPSDIHSRQLFLTLNLFDIVHLRDIIHELKSPTYWVHHSVKNMCKLVSNIIYESSWLLDYVRLKFHLV